MGAGPFEGGSGGGWRGESRSYGSEGTRGGFGNGSGRSSGDSDWRGSRGSYSGSQQGNGGSWAAGRRWASENAGQAGSGLGFGGPAVAMTDEPLEVVEPAWSSDGRWVVAAAGGDDWGRELLAVPVQRSGRVEGRAVRLLAGLGSYARPSLSGDRRNHPRVRAALLYSRSHRPAGQA